MTIRCRIGYMLNYERGVGQGRQSLVDGGKLNPISIPSPQWNPGGAGGAITNGGSGSKGSSGGGGSGGTRPCDLPLPLQHPSRVGLMPSVAVCLASAFFFVIVFLLFTPLRQYHTYQLLHLRMNVCQIPVKLDRNAFRSATEVGFRPVEKAEHQGYCGRIPPESGWNRNPALDSGTPKNRNENRNVPPWGHDVIILREKVGGGVWGTQWCP